MPHKLKDIADVQLGYQHREKIVDVEHGTHRLIQGKDVVRAESHPGDRVDTAGWRIATDNLDRVTPRGDAARYKLRPGDLLFLSRGTTNVAVPLNAESVQPHPAKWDSLIAAYTFYVLRPDSRRVLPEYLAWFINQPAAQGFLARQSRGTLVKLLPKSVFEELEVPLPPLALQQTIVELERLRAREEGLLRQLAAARLRIVQRTCLDAIEAHTAEHTV